MPIARKHLVHLIPNLPIGRIIKLIVQLIHVVRILQIGKVGIILLRKSVMLIDHLRIHPRKPVGKILWMWWIQPFWTVRTRGPPVDVLGWRRRGCRCWSLVSHNRIRPIDGGWFTWKGSDDTGQRCFPIMIVSPPAPRAPLEA